MASDNCGVSVLQTLGPLPGTILGVGLYNIQYTASDLAGNTAVCNFGIQVIDTEDPIIVCPGNILINHTNITECTWESPIGSLTPLLVNSNCPSLVSWSITNPDATINTGLGDASGYIFELGTSNVVYRITEPASGQFWTCSFNVIVTDNTPPTIICPEDLTIECGDTQQSQKIEDWIETATLLDACDNTLNVQASIFSTDSKCGATQTLLYRFVTVDDAGNSSECFANVHIVDTTSPQISGGNDVAINDCTDPNFGNYPEFDFWLTSHAGATATDLCGNVTWSNNYNPVNWVEQCGITKYVDVIFTAKDECGNLSSTTKRFSIGDTEAPTFINCPRPPIIEYAPEGWAATFVNYAPMLATDNCGGVIITQIDGTGYSSGSLFPVGLTTLIFEAEDDCGNTSRCQLQIVVNDYHTPPSFSCGQDITVSTDPQECFATLNNLPPLNITDNAIQNVTAVYGIEHAGEVIASGINVANGNQFPKGVSTVTYRVKDQVLLKITELPTLAQLNTIFPSSISSVLDFHQSLLLSLMASS